MLMENTKKAANELGIDAQFEEVKDYEKNPLFLNSKELMSVCL